MSNNGIATDLILSLMSNGGATLNPRTGLAPRKGYMVGVAGHGMSSPVPVDGVHSVSLVANWLDRIGDVVDRMEAYVGSWRDEDGNRDYFDVSVLFERFEDAVEAARQYGELAIFDLAGMREIRV